MVFQRRKELIISLSYLIYFLHLYLYVSSTNKHYLTEDIKVWLKKLGINKPISNTRALVFLLKYHRPFRNVYYVRITRLKKVLGLFAPPYRGFYFLKSTKLSGGLFLYHPFSTIINAKSIGSNCTIRNNITIGNVEDNNLKLPVIGDNVNIGVGAIIIGNISIGNNAIIGAGAVITKDVPEECVVVGNPARIIKRRGIKVSEILT